MGQRGPQRHVHMVATTRIAEIAGWIIGWHLGAKYLTPSMEQPVWGGAVGDTPVSISVIRYQGKLYYRLYVVEDGESAVVAQGDYPAVLGAVQSWETYLKDGGTVRAWRAERAPSAGDRTTQSVAMKPVKQGDDQPEECAQVGPWSLCPRVQFLNTP